MLWLEVTEPGARVIGPFDKLGRGHPDRPGQRLGVAEILLGERQDNLALLWGEFASHYHALWLGQQATAAVLTLKRVPQQDGEITCAV